MPETLSAMFYVDAESYERERVGVFGREWIILGRTSDLGATGG